MLRKHFMMSGLEKPDYIITYYADLKVPFIGGEETKNLTMWETGTESEPLAEFKVVSDTYTDGHGEWGIKTSNPTAYYSLILDSNNNTYYADSGGTGSITGIIFPEGITEIGGLLLYDNNNLIDIKLPNTLTSIGKNTFNNCTSLVNFNAPLFPPLLSGYDIFGDFTKLLNLKINVLLPLTYEQHEDWNKYNTKLMYYHDPNSLYYRSSQSINTFSDITQNNIYSDNVGEGIIYFTLSPTKIHEYHFSDYKTSLSYILLPNTVTVIDDATFRNCNLLETCILPDSLLSIGTSAFYNCSMLKSINIPKNVKTIGTDAFKYCTNVDTIVVDDANSVYDSRDNCNAIIETASDTLIKGCHNTIIPNSIINIGPYSFYSDKLTDIIIPNSVDEIESYAFYQAGVQHITIPSSVSIIGTNAFSNSANLFVITTSSIEEYCKSLINHKIYNGGVKKALRTIQINNEEITELIIPESITDIPEYTFFNCNSLKKFSAHSNITSIGEYAFYGNKYLTGSIILDSPSLGTYAFYDCTSMTIECVNVPASVPPYCFTNSGLKILKLADGNLEGISTLGCDDCKELAEVYLPDSLTFMNSSCFNGCYIAKNNFVNKSQYTSFPRLKLADEEIDKVLFVDNVVKYSRPSNTHLSIYANTTGIEWWEFPTNLETITVEDANTKYDSRENCNAVIETLTNKLIVGCSNTIIPNTVLIIGSNAFAYCANITKLTIPDTVQTIGYGAFYHMDNLQEITLGSGLQSIGEEALRECRKLHTIRYNGTVEMWNLITKGAHWKTFAVAKTIHCIDGDVKDIT